MCKQDRWKFLSEFRGSSSKLTFEPPIINIAVAGVHIDCYNEKILSEMHLNIYTPHQNFSIMRKQIQRIYTN